MTKDDFFSYCKKRYGVTPDDPFPGDTGETAVFRHPDTRKWFALFMNIPEAKLIAGSTERTDVINLKMPIEMAGSFDERDGVFPAYHMNKANWISVILSRAEDDTVRFLLHASYTATRSKRKNRKNDA